MPKTAVETPICDICGAEVREGSLFCYNCGGSVKDVTASNPVALPDQPVPPPSGANGAAKPIRSERRGARRRRTVNKDQIEIVWESRDGIAPGYVIGAIVLIIAAIALLIVAMWLK